MSLKLWNAVGRLATMWLTDNNVLLVFVSNSLFYLCTSEASSQFSPYLLAFGHATRSVIVGNQTVIDKNFPIRGNAFFIIFKNSPKFEYREFVSTIYAKRKFESSSSTSI